MGLSTLPYDLLLNIALYLDLSDIHALHLTCKTLNDFTTTRPVYRKLAVDLLRKCRALPLKGFQRLTDLTTEQLIRSVNQAARYDNAWRRRAPKPIGQSTSTYGTSHYMDPPSRTALTTVSARPQPHPHPARTWYKVVSAPPGEEVDWLSPITSSYTLCATKSGKVVCWDVQTDQCLAEWNPGERWELWKCRVEFDERTVYFTMAKVLDNSQDDSRVMEFVLMRLTFSDPPSGESSPNKPTFSPVTEFRTTGVVMNIFLLDPSERLLSAFVWVASSNTIGLYALLDWSKSEYVFIDTGIEYAVSANWSCILYDRHIVIHCEEPELAHQYFYPFSLLQSHSAHLPTRLSHPQIVDRVPPARTLTKKFVFPRTFPEAHERNASSTYPFTGSVAGVASAGTAMGEDVLWLNTLSPHMVLLLPSIAPAQAIGATQSTAVPVPSITTAATVGSASPPNPVASGSGSGSISSPSSAVVIGSPGSVDVASSPPSQPLASSSSSSSITSTSTSNPAASTPTSTSTSIPTPTAPLLPHATLPSTPPFHPNLTPHTHPHPYPYHTSSPPLHHLQPHQAPNMNLNPNPFPFPVWYPESAHFVRQWWPTLSNIPRVSCTVVLLAMHDPETHKTKFVLAQHYFKVPIDWGMWVRGEGVASEAGPSTTASGRSSGNKANHVNDGAGGIDVEEEKRRGDEDLLKMWYVSQPFEVVRVFDDRTAGGGGGGGGGDPDELPERPRPLVAVDFGHAVWIEYCDEEEEEEEEEEEDVQINPPTGNEIGISDAGTGGSGNGPSTIIVHHYGDDGDGEGVSGMSSAATATALGLRFEEQDQEDQDMEPKALKFVTFPGYEDGFEEEEWVEEWIEVEVEVEDEDEDEEMDEEAEGNVERKGKQRACDENSTVDGKGGADVKEKGKTASASPINGSLKTSRIYTNGHTTMNLQKPPKTKIKKKIKRMTKRRRPRARETAGVVRTLAVPDELDLGNVETINIDQSQGAVILSDRDGKIFILCYE